VVTVTSLVQAGSAGDVTVIDVALLITRFVAGVAPKLTVVAAVRFVPVTVTEVPPAVEPEDGLTEVTVGVVLVVNVVVVVEGATYTHAT
jgi:hypothetical protein